MSELRQIPGVGPDMERHLNALGVHSLADLRTQDAETLYARDCALHGGRLDRCVLYVYRLAVYYAQTDTPEPEKLKWQNWKD